MVSLVVVNRTHVYSQLTRCRLHGQTTSEIFRVSFPICQHVQTNLLKSTKQHALEWSAFTHSNIRFRKAQMLSVHLKLVCVCVCVSSFDQHVWYPSDSSSTRQPSLLTAAFPQPCLTARPLTEPPCGKRESRALTIYHAWALLAIQCQHKGICVRRGGMMKLACCKTVLEKQRPAHVNTGSTGVHKHSGYF